jgi:Glycosyl transferase TarS linker domain
VRRDPEYNRELHGEIRRLALERYGPDVERFLPFNLRVRSRLLRDGSYESLMVLAAFENELRADVVIKDVRWEEGVLALELQASLGGEHEPLTVVRRGARMHWVPPAGLREELAGAEFDITDDLEECRVQILLRSRRNQAEYVVPARHVIVFVRAPGGADAKQPVLIAATEIDPGTAAAGSKLRAGDWDVQVLVSVVDFAAVAGDMSRAGKRFARRRRKPLTLTVTRDRRLIERQEVRRRMTRRLPGVTKRFRRFKRRGRAAIARARRRAPA